MERRLRRPTYELNLHVFIVFKAKIDRKSKRRRVVPQTSLRIVFFFFFKVKTSFALRHYSNACRNDINMLGLSLKRHVSISSTLKTQTH